MQPHNAAATLRRLARAGRITTRVTRKRAGGPAPPSGSSKAFYCATCSVEQGIKADTTVGYD
jgi:hypothetical protein